MKLDAANKDYNQMLLKLEEFVTQLADAKEKHKQSSPTRGKHKQELADAEKKLTRSPTQRRSTAGARHWCAIFNFKENPLADDFPWTSHNGARRARRMARRMKHRTGPKARQTSRRQQQATSWRDGNV